MASNEPSSRSNPKPAELPAKTREEGEISSSDNDENALWSVAEPIVMIKPSAPIGPIQVPPLGKNTQGSLAGKDVSSSNVKPSNGKSFEKSQLPLKYAKPGWHAPSGGNSNLVISFSDDDSASESEDNRQEMASEIKCSTAKVYGNQRLPLLSSAKTSSLHKNGRNVNKVIPKKLSLNHKFVSSISRTNRAANSKGSGPSSNEQGPRIRNVYTINKTTANQPCGSDQGTGLDNMKLRDLRQQIALRERELRIRAARQTRDSVSVSAREHGAVNLCRDASKKSVLMAADAAVLNPREPEKKRLKLVSGSYSTQVNLDYPLGRSVEKSTIPLQKEALANSSLVDRNIPDCSKKAIPISRVQSSLVKLQKQDDNQPVISPQDLTCSNINDNCSQSIRSGMQVDPSVILSQATPLTFMNSSTLQKNIKSVQSNDLIKSGKQHPPGLFLKTSTSEQKLNIDSEYCDSLCGNTTLQPSMNKICLASPNNVTQRNVLGSMNVAEHRRDIRSLVEMEESLDKELEEAQEHRRKCEIEERNALKAYRRAQRDLIEANALCTELYHKRELYSAQFRSFVINDSSLLWSSRQHEYVGMASNIPNNASKNLDLVLNSSHQMQPESDGCSQPADDTSMHYISGAPLHTSHQHMNGQNLSSEPCSEPDASMSEPLPRNSNNGANRESIPSNDPNISAEEDETSPLDNEVVQPNFKNKQTGQHSLGEQKESHKLNNSIDGSQDSLILEATLRSELFARLRTRNTTKNSGLSNVETADNLGTENDNESERTQASNSSLPFSEAEKNQEYDFEGNDKTKRDQSGVPFQVQSHEMDSIQLHPSLNSEDGGYSVGVYQLETATILCPPLIVRSVFGCIKEMFPMNPFGLQRVKNKHDNPSDNYLEDGVCFNSQEIQCRKGTDNSVEETVKEICGQEIGSYSYSAAIDPSWPLCMYELRGKCNNDDCPWQHARDFFNQNVDRHQSEFSSADCQVGLASCSQEHDGAKGPSKFCCALTPPTYLVGLDTLKAEPYSCQSIVARKRGQFWQKFFSICLASSSFPQVDVAADEPFLNENDSRIEVHRSWNRQSSYFQNRNSMVDHVSQGVPSNVQSLEMALLILNQEVNNLETKKKCLSVLSRAIEVDPTSEILWIVYLLIFYSQNVSIGKDDMFSYAVKHNETSYVLWLLYINSRVQFDDCFVAYNDALAALLRWAAAFDRVEMHASACILDLFLQMMDCLCMSGNVGKAIQKINKLFPEETDSDEPHSSLLSDILTCLVISDRYIFWVCCIYLVMYRKLPDAVVHRFECEKELNEIEWPPVHLLDKEKQRVLQLVEIAIGAVEANVSSELSNSEASLAQNFALCHVRCVMALDGLEHCQALLEKYMKLYPHCIEFVLISARLHTSHSGGSGVKAFEEALSKWPREVPGIHCIWNQYIEFSLERGGLDFAKELITGWIDFVSKGQHTRNESLDAVTSNRPDGSFESGSVSSPDLLVANSSQMDKMFGYLNLSLAKLMDKDLVEARFAIDRALRASTPQYINHCLREYAMFFLAYKSQSVKVSSISEQLSMLNEYLDDVQAFCVLGPLSRQFINRIEKPRVKQLVCNLLTPVSSDSFTVNLVLKEWYGPSLLPQKLGQPKELVDFVEAVLEIVPSNYQLVFSVFKWLSRDGKHVNISLDSMFFWASSALVNAICCVVPIAPEYVWAEAASTLLDIPGIDSLSENFYRRALSAYPFSSKLWNSYYSLSKRTREDASTVMETARKRGIELG